jgi:hypothetical protein
MYDLGPPAAVDQLKPFQDPRQNRRFSPKPAITTSFSRTAAVRPNISRSEKSRDV